MAQIIPVEAFKQLLEDSELVRIEEFASQTFYGFTLERTVSDADPLWNVLRASQSGGLIELLTASGKFDQVWDNRATLFGAPPFADTRSVICDGVNDHLLIGNVAVLDFDGTTDAFSICGHFRTNQTAEKIIFSKQAGGNNVGYRITSQSNQVRMHISGGAAGNRIEVRSPDLSLADDAWHHVCMMYDGSGNASGVSMVIDRVDQTSSLTLQNDTLTSWGVNVLAAQISGRNGTVAEWDGFLNEIAVFNVELSVAEAIATSAAGAVDPAIALDLNQHAQAASMVGYWRFDNDVFPNVLDRSNVGNNLTAIMTNMTASDLVSEVST